MKKNFLLFLVTTIFFVSCGDDKDRPDFDELEIKSINIEPLDEDVFIYNTYQLTWEFDGNASVLPANLLKFSSSNTDILTVSNTGQITGVSEGEAIVTVSWQDKSDALTIQVNRSDFNHSIGRTIEEVNPQVKISDDFGYHKSIDQSSLSLTAYTFKDDIVTSVWYCNEATGTAPSKLRDVFESNVKRLNPPKEITFELNTNLLSAECDSLSWNYQDCKVLIRNGEILYKQNNQDAGEIRPYLICEFTSLK